MKPKSKMVMSVQNGLTVRGGMLRNNRPDGVMGITHIVKTAKAIKREEKTSMIAEGVMRGDLMSDVMEMM